MFSTFLVMSHSQILKTRLCGRLFQSVVTSAFAFSAVTGGVMLSGGEVKAAPIVCIPTSTSFNDPALSPSHITDTLSNGDSTHNGGTCQVDSTGLLFPNNQSSVTRSYTPTNLTGTDTFSYTYTKTATNPGDTLNSWFDQVSLSIADSNPGEVERATKIVYDFQGGTELARLTTLGTTVSATLPNRYTSLYIVDEINANGGSISRVTNGFRQTPGPLPILGAGAAFGFSRKLRGRIKAARLG